MTDYIDLNQLDWHDASNGYTSNPYSTMYKPQTVETEEFELVLALDLRNNKASMAIKPAEHGFWFDTISPATWPEFDKRFGRDNWQRFLTEWQQTVVQELEQDMD